jgi:signal transduction histidine kinase
MLLLFCALPGCRQAFATEPPQPASEPRASSPSIEITSVPVAGKGSPATLSTIRGRVNGALPGQQIVLYAKADDDNWWVQPFAKHPFTSIQSNSRWQNSTHPGSEYAALLVQPEFQPPLTTESLPTHGVVAFAIARGGPALWQRWWFPFLGVSVCALAAFSLYRLRLHQLTMRLKLSFEERLAERMRVAQELHDGLLQGVLSASMQLHVAVDQLPADSPAQPCLNRVLKLMGQVINEGRNTVRGLRFSSEGAGDLEHAFLRVQQELDADEKVDFRVIVEGPLLPLCSVIHDEVYSIGREALVNAFRHSRASSIEVELQYAVDQMRLLVRDNGCGIDPQVLDSGREGHWGLRGMRERAERIGAHFRVFSRIAAGTEVELAVPSDVAFESHPSGRASKWFTRLYPRKMTAGTPKADKRAV